MNTILLAANAALSTGWAIFKPFYWVFGKCMSVLLDLLGNRYFLALVIFTFVTRLILLPLNVKQQKTMASTTRLQPKIKKIQNKYGSSTNPKDRQKMQEEMNALYAREGHNPMQMGCGPMIFQMIFLMGIIGIIYYPIQYVIGISNFTDNAQAIYDAIEKTYFSIAGEDSKMRYLQLEILQHFSEYQSILVSKFPKLFTSENCVAIQEYRDGMTLFGLDMTAIPHWKDWKSGIIAIPIICLVTSLGSSFVSMRIQKVNNPAAASQMGSMNMMLFTMPVFSFVISFNFPAAVGFYWIISNIVAILQQFYIFKAHPPKKTQARLMVENTIQRRAREENVKKIK